MRAHRTASSEISTATTRALRRATAIAAMPEPVPISRTVMSGRISIAVELPDERLACVEERGIEDVGKDQKRHVAAALQCQTAVPVLLKEGGTAR